MKNLLCFIILMISVTAITLMFALDMSEKKTAYNYLKENGWSVDEKVIESCEVNIPNIFDDVYNNYNELQKEAGFDLTKYKGKKAVRYTYKLQNDLRANVLIYNNTVIGGDICTVDISGYMKPLINK